MLLPMPSPRAVLAALPLALAVLGAATPAGAEECQEAISQQNTQKLFNALNKLSPSEGCSLESVGTKQSQMAIVWKKGGRRLEPILVVPTSCAKAPSTRGKVLSSVVPPSVTEACPAAVSAMAALLETDTFGGLVTLGVDSPGPDAAAQPSQMRPRPRPAARIAGGIAVALLVAAGVVALQQRRKKKQGGGAGPTETTMPPAESAPAAKPVAASGSPENEPSAKPVKPIGSPDEDPDTSGPPTA